MTKNKKYTPKMNKKNMKGGAKPGTSGSVDVLVEDIFSIAKSTVETIINTTKLIVDIVELPGDIGKAYDEPAAQLLKI